MLKAHRLIPSSTVAILHLSDPISRQTKTHSWRTRIMHLFRSHTPHSQSKIWNQPHYTNSPICLQHLVPPLRLHMLPRHTRCWSDRWLASPFILMPTKLSLYPMSLHLVFSSRTGALLVAKKPFADTGINWHPPMFCSRTLFILLADYLTALSFSTSAWTPPAWTFWRKR